MERLELRHRKRIEELLRKHPPTTCELTFPSLYAWRAVRDMSVLDLGDTVALASERKKGLILFGPPLGKRSLPETFQAVQCMTDMPVIACERIPENALGGFDTGGMELIDDRNNFDYVYRRNDLAFLEGRKYHKKRNLIAQCLSDQDCTYESITPQILPEIQDMQDRWCAERDCGKTPGLCHEYQAIKQLLDNAKELDVIGGAIRIGGTIEAYTIGSRLNDNTAAIHVEKAMGAYKGLYQVINKWFCERELRSYDFVNREQDVGAEGIRRAKESYFPDHMIKKYAILHTIDRNEYEKLRTKEAHCE